MKSYQYKPLPTQQDPKTIRLLELLPGEPAAPIKCKLVEVSLTQSPCYEAISYRWGGDKLWIVVDEFYKLEIQRNLYSALYHLRRASQSRILWADAICINQGDEDEKGSQVRIVRDIYQKARRTVIWLGDDPEVAAGLALFYEAARWQESQNHTHQQNTVSPFGLRVGDYPLMALVLDSEYFKRVWVIQEVAVSSEVELMCEFSFASWDDLVSVSKACHGTVFMYTSGPLNVQLIAKARERFQQDVYPSLLFLLSSYRSFRSTQRKDMIYALLGLVNPSKLEATGIVPNYDKDFSDEEMYIAVARSLLSTSGDLDLLSLSSQSGSESLHFPSWVPDWTQTTVASSFVDFSVQGKANDQSAVTRSFCATKVSKSRPIFSSDSRSVCLRGHVVDVVNAVGRVAQPLPKFSFAKFQDKSWFQVIMQLAKGPFEGILSRCGLFLTFGGWEKITGARTRKPYRTGEDMQDVFWKTFAGYIPGGDADAWAKEKAEIEHSTRFCRYLCYLHLHHSFVTLAVGICLSMPVWFMLALLGLIPISYDPRADFYVHRAMFNTQDGYIGLGPRGIQHGDQIALFEGGRVPFVIRRNGSGYRLIGDCYIHGVMSGERYDPTKCVDFWII